jgi:hypothetical protein
LHRRNIGGVPGSQLRKKNLAKTTAMATFTKEVLKEGGGAAIQVGQNVTVEANLYLAKDMTAIW